MAQQTIQRSLVDKGLNLVQSAQDRLPVYASSMKNAQYRKSGAPEKRPGYQGHAPSAGGIGSASYNRVNPATGIIEPEYLALDQELQKLTITQILVHYAGAEDSCTLSIYFDATDDTYKCEILEGITTVLSETLGKGIDEPSPYSVTNLAAAINGLSGFTATVTGTGSTPAAFIKIVRDFQLSGDDDWTGEAAAWTSIPCPISTPYDESFDARFDADFEDVTFAQIQNIMLLSSPRENCYKYDGVSLYRAGVPRPASLSSAEGGAGNVNGSNYFHRAVMVMKDAVGNYTYGNYLQVSSGLSPSSKIVNLTIANVQASTGFKTNCAIVNGAQVAVNSITVDASHTIKVGDTAYFFDSVSAAYVEREVTAIGATSITVDGVAVTVADNAVISANLRILLLRNKTSATTSPSLFYIVAEIPNDSFNATQAYADNLADASLGALFTFDSVDRSPPPKGKYITTFQNLAFIANLEDAPYDIAWSDLVAGPECFDLAVNSDTVQSSRGDVLSGIAPNGKFLAIGADKTIHVGSGTFGDGNYFIEERASFIGVSSHHSMAQAEGVLVFWSERGPYQMVNGQMPSPLGVDESNANQRIGRIEPIMSENKKRNNQSLMDQFFQTKRITAFNWIDENKVLFFLPCETASGDFKFANTNSPVYAYDYQRDAWLYWTNVNMASGMHAVGSEIYFQCRRFSNVTSETESELFRFHNLGDAWDYADNDEPIDWEFGAPWESLGNPAALKNFQEISAKSLEDLPNNSFTMQVDQEFDYQVNSVSASLFLDFESSGYGQNEYSTGAYGDPAALAAKHDLKRERCKSCRVVFKNNEIHENVLITSWELLVSNNYGPGFKK